MKKVISLEEPKEKGTYDMFNKVFLPTFLSIIGVILFLRLGFIVGVAGIIPTLAIIVLAVSVTIATALSISSITTNIRIGDGGVYSIISKTLGLEIGGSIGIPLYLAQVFSVSLYLFGFLEVWNYIFPNYPQWLILGSLFTVLILSTYISTKIAVKTQLVVFIILLGTLATILFSNQWVYNVVPGSLIGSFGDYSFWGLFALFFPAVTGIMAGIGLSGELSDPKKQIPRGIFLAIVLTTAIYIFMALWYNFSASPQDLTNNYYIILDLAIIGPLVLLGIFASTFSSALTTFLAAPRLLNAMVSKSLFPGSKYLLEKNSEIPHKAIIFTSIPIIITLALANLDFMAQLITMFFLITYAVLNLVVFFEQQIGLVSFRPTFKIPKFVPLYGAITSIIIMFLINVIVGFIALGFVIFTYNYLVQRKLKSKEGDIRSGLFISFSEWAARKVESLPVSKKHVWKPNILIPIVNTNTLLGNFSFIKSIIYPGGNMTVLGLDLSQKSSSPKDSKKNSTKNSTKNFSLLKDLPILVKKFGEEGIFTSSSTVSAKDYTSAICISLSAIESQTFSPNVLFLPFKPERLPARSLKKIFITANRLNTGLILADKDEEVGLGSQEDVNVWIPSSVVDKEFFDDRSFDLALLVGYRLHRNWHGTISLWMCVPEGKKLIAQNYLKKISYEARLPASTKIIVSIDSFNNTLTSAPSGDVHLIAVSSYEEVIKIKKIKNVKNKSIYFIVDSRTEDILA
jgi:solute carrier family 12 (sodium/potassium/chloride transporter), member 2